MNWLIAPAIAFLIALIPSLALAEDGESQDDLLLRVGSDVVVRGNETVGSLIVIDGDVLIEGMVKNNVLVIDGNVIVTGAVAANITVISGSLELRKGAFVKNVTTISSSLIREDGVTMTGETNDPGDLVFVSGVAGALSFLFWAAMTLAVVAAGLIFAAVGGRQLNESARTATADIANTAIAAVLVWIGIPILAVLAMTTLIGLPLGIGLLVFLLPAMWFLGYIVVAAALGNFIVGFWRRGTVAHPYLGTFVGLTLLQLGVLLPFIGALVAFLAGLWGAGALAFIAYRAAGGKGFWSGRAPAGPQTQPAG